MLTDFWRGQLPLAVTFWLFGAAVLAALVGLFVYLGVVHPNGTIGVLAALTFLALNAVTAVYWIFVSVAIWRSAGAYEGPQLWSLLARGLVLAIYLWSIVWIVMSYGHRRVRCGLSDLEYLDFDFFGFSDSHADKKTARQPFVRAGADLEDRRCAEIVRTWIDGLACNQFVHNFRRAMTEASVDNRDQGAVARANGVARLDLCHTVGSNELPVGAAGKDHSGEAWSINSTCLYWNHATTSQWHRPQFDRLPY